MAEALTDINSFSFVLAVPNLETSAAYFRDALGFRLDWPDGIGWKLATRGGVRVMIGHCPDAMLPSATGDHNYFGYLHVTNANALHEELVARGAIILCVFRMKVTGRFGIVTDGFGNVTGRFGNVTERTGQQVWRCA